MKKLLCIASTLLFLGCGQEADLTIDDATFAIKALHQDHSSLAVKECATFEPKISDVAIGDEALVTSEGLHWSANATLRGTCDSEFYVYPIEIDHNYRISRDGDGNWKAMPDTWKKAKVDQKDLVKKDRDGSDDEALKPDWPRE